MNTDQVVLGVAIVHDDTDLVFFLPKPARHHDVIKAMVDLGIPAPIGNAQMFRQGFMTKYGFRDRTHTHAIIGRPPKIGAVLTSEDLW